MRVKDLKIGDRVKWHTGIEVIVREYSESGVLVSKPNADRGCGLMSIPFCSHKFDDNYNRVELIIPIWDLVG